MDTGGLFEGLEFQSIRGPSHLSRPVTERPRGGEPAGALSPASALCPAPPSGQPGRCAVGGGATPVRALQA